MREVAVYEAKARLSDLLDDVEHGDEVTITRRGVAVARLVSAQSPPATAERQRDVVSDVFKKLRLFRQEVTLDRDASEAAAYGRA